MGTIRTEDTVEFSVADNAKKAPELRGMRSLVANVLAGVARKQILFLADSTTAAMIGGGNSAGARAKSPPSIAAKLLNGAGIEARADAVFGNASIDAANAVAYAAYNPDISFGAGWAAALGSSTYLTNGFWSNSTNTNPAIYTPQRAADRFDLYFIKASGSGNGTFTVTDSSGTLATIDTNTGSYAVYKQTVSRAVADRTPISIQRNGTGGAIYLGAIVPWNSILPELCLLNAARAGGMASEMLSAGAPPMAKGFIDVIAADGHYIEFGLNEKNTAVALSSFQASLNSLIDNTQLLGSGVVSVGISAPATAGNSYDLPGDWRQAIADIATAQGCPLVDHYSRFVSREALPGDYSDQVHLNFAGYAVKGRAIFDMLVS